MPNYRRAFSPGGTFFITLVTHRQRKLFDDSLARTMLRESLDATRRDRLFELDAIVLLPDHLHSIITLPDGDSDFSTRVGAIKGRFSRAWLKAGGSESSQSRSLETQGYAGIWQKRFWEHCIRDVTDMNRCLDYIHYNPLKHNLAHCPHGWAWSSFDRFVASDKYLANWLCTRDGRQVADALPTDIPGAEMD